MTKNTYFAKVNHFRYYYLSSILLLLVAIWLISFSINSFGQVVIPLSHLNSDLFKHINGKVRDVVVIDEHIFIGTDEGLWVVSKDGTAIKVKSIKSSIWRIDEFSDRLFVDTIDEGFWIASKDGTAIRVDNGIDVGEFFFASVVDDRLFVATTVGLWIVSKDGKVIEARKVKGKVEIMTIVGEQAIANASGVLWIVNKDGEATEVENVKGHVRKLVGSGFGSSYVMAEDNLFRLDPGITIKTRLSPIGSWANFISKFLPTDWLPSEKVQATASYSDKSGKDPYPKTFSREFRFAKADGDLVPPNEKFSPQEQFSYEIGLGKNEVHYWVKDKGGNTFEHTAIYYGVPSQYLIVVLPFILSAIFVLTCFALAPKISFCHSAIMNPWLRKYFSLGSVPLLLSVFPSLRRYTLRRYSALVSRDKEFIEWKKRFVYPDEEFQPENFGKILEGERRLLFTGQSGIGKTSFFKHLTASYASLSKPSLPTKVFPVYIPLTNYGGNSLEDLVYNQLFSYGRITDKEMAPMFLEQGGLLIFLDGVNEVQTIADRQKLGEFVERFWKSNYICLSSQQSYPEIENIPKIELKTFSKEKVCEFIKQRVNDKENAENVIKKLSDEDYQLYSVPRDLEFAVEIINGGEKSLPKSRTELYKITFSSLFAKWKKKGDVEAEDYLCKHAYTMIVQRDLAFDSVDNPIFKEITTDLFEQKFLVRREKSYTFRHDLIRSYLASEYFYPRWKNLFEQLNGKAIDSNWLEMLKFSCENIEDSNEVKSLVYEVLERSVRKDLVKQLFEWLKANHPSKCKTWENNFYTKYGELDFK
jgi:hypothetical protein